MVEKCTIIDYGMGNVGSIQNMLARMLVHAELTRDPATIAKAGFLILPGVGAFDAAMTKLRDLGLVEAIDRRVREDGVPVLGICLGMQLMMEGSEEGVLPGFGWISGRVTRLDPPPERKLRVPHMGWNRIERRNSHPAFSWGEPAEGEKFYFVHSYAAHCTDRGHALAVTEYGETFDSVIGRDNIVGAQFHPEKSHSYGLALLSQMMKWSAS